MLERLQKIIARAGIASRRHAEELIRSGQVRVNGVVVTELGAKADPEHDRVEAAGRVAERPAEPRYFMLHKPVHVVATMSDPEGRATLRHLLRGMTHGVFPVGRLDYDVSGLMLLTNDGELGDRISKSLARMVQVYWVKMKGRPSEETLRKVGHAAGARLRLLGSPGSASTNAANPWYEVSLSEAPRDLLRTALFEAGHPVEKMKRVRLSFLDLGNLPEGLYRQLAPEEVAQLRRSVERVSANTARAIQVSGAPSGTSRFGSGAAKPRRKFWRPKTLPAIPGRPKFDPAKPMPAMDEPTPQPAKFDPASPSANFGSPKSGPAKFGRPKFEPRKFGSGKPGGARPGNKRFEPRKFGSGKPAGGRPGSNRFEPRKFGSGKAGPGRPGHGKSGPRKSGPPKFRKDRP